MAKHDNVKLQLTRYSSGGWTNADNMIDGNLDTVAYVNSPTFAGQDAYFTHSVKNLLPSDTTVHSITVTCVGMSAAAKTHFNAGLELQKYDGATLESLLYIGSRSGVQSSPTTYYKTFTPEDVEAEMKTAGNVQYRQYYQTGDRTKMPTLLDLINGNVSMYYTNNSAEDTHGYIVGLRVSASKKLGSTAGKVTISEAYITISYTLPDYTLTVTAGTGGTVAGGGTYESGQTATITATPSSGYKFVKWSDGNTSATRTVTVTADATYTATFERTGYTLTVTAGEGGTVTGGGTYNSGATVTITATPNSGYRFVKWSDGNTNATRTVTVTADVTYTATFALLAYVTYDSIFSLLSWRKHGISGSNAAVSDISNTGFTLTSNAGAAEGTASSHYFAVEPGKSYKIDIDITGDNWDVYIFFCDASGNWIDFADSTNRFSSNGGGVPSRIFTAPAGTVKAQIRVDANGASNTVSYSNFRIYPADYEYMSDTVSAAERTDIGAWSMPTPTRSGYKFVGWNTKPDGAGTAYTASSGFPTADMTLYSQWQENPPEITSAELIYSDKQVSAQNKVPAGQSFIIRIGAK